MPIIISAFLKYFFILFFLCKTIARQNISSVILCIKELVYSHFQNHPNSDHLIKALDSHVKNMTVTYFAAMTLFKKEIDEKDVKIAF